MPVVCDKLVYLELQKTGCTTIGRVLADLFGGELRPPQHGLLSEDEKHKCVVGSVRNPWDFYVSLWSYGCEGRGWIHEVLTQRRWHAALEKLPHPRPVLRELLRPVSPWRACYTAPHTPDRFRSWLTRVHTASRAREFDPSYGSASIRHFAGYATYRYCRLYSHDLKGIRCARSTKQLREILQASFLPDVMVRTEHLADDLLSAARTAGYEVDLELEANLRDRCEDRANVSSHLPYTEYYDERTRDLVASRDAVIIDAHGYVFGA